MDFVGTVLVLVFLVVFTYYAYKLVKSNDKRSLLIQFDEAIDEALTVAEDYVGKAVESVDEAVDEVDEYVEKSVEYMQNVYYDILTELAWDEEKLREKLKAEMKLRKKLKNRSVLKE